MERGGEKDGVEDPVVGDAQHQLRASSGGLTRRNQAAVTAPGGSGATLQPVGCVEEAARPLRPAHGIAASSAGGHGYWRTDHGERERWVCQGRSVVIATRQTLVRCCTTSLKGPNG
jgi:hypothetical protein